MSGYEWESGTIVIPTAEWSKFRTALITEWNKQQEKIFTDAGTVLKRLKANNKGKRKVDWRKEASHLIYNMIDDVDRENEIYGLIISREGKPVTPKKKDLHILPVSKSAVLQLSEVTIKLDNDTHSIRYSVSENNHACDDAHQLPIVRKMFSLLGEIKWTRRSGGEIVGNDEYNRESEGCGGGANYCKYSYGLKR